MKMYIDTGDHKPIALKPYRIPLGHIKYLDEQIDKLLISGIIRHSTSSWSSPVVLVSKKERTFRLFIDFRMLISVM